MVYFSFNIYQLWLFCNFNSSNETNVPQKNQKQFEWSYMLKWSTFVSTDIMSSAQDEAWSLKVSHARPFSRTSLMSTSIEINLKCSSRVRTILYGNGNVTISVFSSKKPISYDIHLKPKGNLIKFNFKKIAKQVLIVLVILHILFYQREIQETTNLSNGK